MEDLPENDGIEDVPQDKHVGVESVVSIGVAAAALVPDRPYIGLLAAGLGPGLVHLLLNRRQNGSDAAAAVTLAEACQVSGSTSNELAAMCESNRGASMLLGDVIQAAYNTLYPAKLIALGRCLGEGLTDDTRLDVEWVVARAMANIEEPHILVLAQTQAIGAIERPADHHPGVARSQLADKLPMLVDALTALCAALEREGCIKPVTNFEHDGVISWLEDVWEITDFGDQILLRIHAASDPLR